MGQIQVHYEGFDSRHDEWLPKDSTRIVTVVEPAEKDGLALGDPSRPGASSKEELLVEVPLRRASDSPAALAGAAPEEPDAGPGEPRQYMATDTKTVPAQDCTASPDTQMPFTVNSDAAAAAPGVIGPPAAPRDGLSRGARVTVLSKTGKERACTIAEVLMGQVQVHYEGFDSRHDEWLPRDSTRIVAVVEPAEKDGLALGDPSSPCASSKEELLVEVPLRRASDSPAALAGAAPEETAVEAAGDRDGAGLEPSSQQASREEDRRLSRSWPRAHAWKDVALHRQLRGTTARSQRRLHRIRRHMRGAAPKLPTRVPRRTEIALGAMCAELAGEVDQLRVQEIAVEVRRRASPRRTTPKSSWTTSRQRARALTARAPLTRRRQADGQ
ncbi:unnamed protein product [Prorocentrum cordatum]|uniref:Tudor-knot domain-containing protein n=1 Tax=Prorocentrum cordatum TaxID=2364126 RepID=A0ABN9U0C6_9DINO|nr:unnamed protein product [Polarella glacialis]